MIAEPLYTKRHEVEMYPGLQAIEHVSLTAGTRPRNSHPRQSVSEEKQPEPGAKSPSEHRRPANLCLHRTSKACFFLSPPAAGETYYFRNEGCRQWGGRQNILLVDFTRTYHDEIPDRRDAVHDDKQDCVGRFWLC
jgi:hypothetical protein